MFSERFLQILLVNFLTAVCIPVVISKPLQVTVQPRPLSWHSTLCALWFLCDCHITFCISHGWIIFTDIIKNLTSCRLNHLLLALSQPSTAPVTRHWQMDYCLGSSNTDSLSNLLCFYLQISDTRTSPRQNKDLCVVIWGRFITLMMKFCFVFMQEMGLVNLKCTNKHFKTTKQKSFFN